MASKKGKSENVDLEKALGHQFEPTSFEFSEREVISYALGVGEGTDPMDDSQLKFVYENHPEFQPLPTMAVCFPFSVLGQVITTPGLSFNPMMLLHGEQYLELKAPLPTSGKLTSKGKVAHIYDKGKGALVIVDCNTFDESGKEVCFNQISLFIRGIGGFGGDRGGDRGFDNRGGDRSYGGGDRGGDRYSSSPRRSERGGFDKPRDFSDRPRRDDRGSFGGERRGYGRDFGGNRDGGNRSYEERD